MVHLRIVAPDAVSDRVIDLLERSDSVCNVTLLSGVVRNPTGDLITADVAREDASVVISDLKDLGVHREGTIALEQTDTHISERAELVEERAAGVPSDAVVWEEVEARTEDTVELSGVYLTFMVIAGLLAAVGIYQDSPILIVGAMVVGPEFGPLAGLCVALVQRRRRLAVRSALALAVGFPLAIAVVCGAVFLFRATGLFPPEFSDADHNLSNVIAQPDFFAFFVAACAGAAGMLSLSTAKSGALIGVLISVTTIPAAANVGVSAIYGDWDSCTGSLAQLAINLGSIIVAGTAVLAVQRALYLRRREAHLADPERAAAGLGELTPSSPATPRSRASS